MQLERRQENDHNFESKKDEEKSLNKTPPILTNTPQFQVNEVASSITSSLSRFFEDYKQKFQTTGIQTWINSGTYSFTVSAYLSGRVHQGVKQGALGVATTCLGVIMEPILQKIGSTIQNNKFFKNNINPYFNKIPNYNSFKPAITIAINITITRLVLSILTACRRHILSELVNIVKGTVATFALGYALNKFTAQPLNPTTIYLSF